MADKVDLPQDPEGTQLPGRGDTLTLDDSRDVSLLLYDTAMDVWTVRDEASGELTLIRLGSDLSWQQISLDIEYADSHS